jgi:hypothetical protein
MITVLFAAFLLLSMMVALVDWRRGWLLAILCGVLQDPARKVTTGTPVVMSLSIVIVYIVVLFAAQGSLQRYGKDFTKRFGNIYGGFILVLLFLALAAVNGVVTFGVDRWQVPALSLLIYCIPLPAVILGFAWVQREEQIEGLFRFYATITSIAMVGTVAEYFDLGWRTLGTVALSGTNLRWLPGIEIRMLSGFYRAPDIMGWHAATLCCIGILMALRRRELYRAAPWMMVAGWGFLNCIISGRRKAVYMVAVFAAAFLWRYFRRLKVTEIVTVGLVVCTLALVVSQMMKDEGSSVYTRGTGTTGDELLGRLEGGFSGTVEQYGFLGAGLGTATQGTQHLVGGAGFAWQEGGLGKLAIELGVPGLVAIAIMGFALTRTLLHISSHPDIPESSQLLRAGLFGIFCADVGAFLASAQAYSDPVLTLMTTFLLGCLFSTATLDDRAKEQAAAAAEPVVTRGGRLQTDAVGAA